MGDDSGRSTWSTICTRECLTIQVERSFSGAFVARILDRIVAERGRPEAIVCENGPEFISRALEIWADANGIVG